MSQKRDDDMAIIAAALENGLVITDNDSGERIVDTGQLQPTPTPEPVVDTGFPNSPIKDVKAELEGQGSKVAPSEKEKLLAQQKRNSLIQQRLLATGRSAGQTLNSVQNGLGNVPMPGGIAVPLIVLTVFLMLLVKINGHTRLEWLWLVVTKNAQVQNAGTGGGGPMMETQVIQDVNPVQLPTVVPLPFLRASYEMDEW